MSAAALLVHVLSRSPCDTRPADLVFDPTIAC
jgi:hypothetical protein